MAKELYISSSATVQPYAIIRQRSTLKVADIAGEALVEFLNASLADYVVLLASGGGDLWAADFPTWLAAGNYLVQLYDQAGASPATTDKKLRDIELYWSGSSATPTGSTGGASGVYCTQADVERRYLAGNVAAFSNLGRDENAADVNVIQAAIGEIDRFLNEQLRNNGYVTPIDSSAAEFGRLTDIAVDLVFVRLMKAHVVHVAPGQNGNGRELFFTRREAMANLERLLHSEPHFERLSDAPEYPVAAE